MTRNQRIKLLSKIFIASTLISGSVCASSVVTSLISRHTYDKTMQDKKMYDEVVNLKDELKAELRKSREENLISENVYVCASGAVDDINEMMVAKSKLSEKDYLKVQKAKSLQAKCKDVSDVGYKVAAISGTIGLTLRGTVKEDGLRVVKEIKEDAPTLPIE